MIRVSTDFINSILSDKENTYDYLLREGNKFLPDIDSRGCTLEWLRGVLENKYFTIDFEDGVGPKKLPKVSRK